MGSVVWWPREQLTCKLIMGSWTLSKYDLNLKIREGEKENPFAGFGEQENWSEVTQQTKKWMMIRHQAGWRMEVESVERHEVFYDCCPDEPYVDITYTLKLTRAGKMEPLLLSLSVIVLISMVLLSCWIPVDSGNMSLASGRLMLLLFPVIATIILLIYCQMHIPANFETPVIVRVLLTLLVMEGVAISSFILNFILVVQQHRAEPISPDVKLGFLTRYSAYQPHQ